MLAGVTETLVGVFRCVCVGEQHAEHADDLDPDAADAAAAYKIKMSKWYKGTFDAIQNPLFWYLMTICRCFRRPLRHFFCFVQQQAKNSNEGEVLRQLVTHKLEELQEEYRVIHNNLNQIIARAMETSGCDQRFKDDPAAVDSLAFLARKVCMQQWASFQRRIYYPLQQILVCINFSFLPFR